MLKGKGTLDNPYLIYTKEDLKKISNTDFHYKIMKDIDLKDENWDPIKSFGGVLDGNFKVISNLRCINKNEKIGLIAYLRGTIKNLAFTNVCIENKGDRTGIIASNSSRSLIENIYVNGCIKGEAYTGAIIGANEGTVRSCCSDAFVSGGDRTGGIVGNSNDTISYCLFNGTLEINEYLINKDNTAYYGYGGIAGQCFASYSKIEKSFSRCKSNVNRFRAICKTGTLRDCFYIKDTDNFLDVKGEISLNEYLDKSVFKKAKWDLEINEEIGEPFWRILNKEELTLSFLRFFDLSKYCIKNKDNYYYIDNGRLIERKDLNEELMVSSIRELKEEKGIFTKDSSKEKDYYSVKITKDELGLHDNIESIEIKEGV